MSGRSNSARRHCMVVHAYYPLGETRVQRETAALVERGWEVDVICLRGADESRTEVVDGGSIHRLPVRRHRGSSTGAQLIEYLAFFLLATLKLTGLHISRRYDTVQVHNLPDFLVFAALVPKLMGAAVVLDLHDLMPELYAARTGKGMGAPLPRLLLLQERLATAFADHVITVTEIWQQTLVRRSTRWNKVSVVMNLADPRIFNRQGANSGEYDHFSLVYHGTFTHRYGVDLPVHALAELRDEIPRARLLLLGDGEMRDELSALVGELDLEGRVDISDGMVGIDDLPGILRRSDVGLVPNRSSVFTEEILPTKLLEYVAMGIPVIAARTAALKYYFDDDMVEFFEPGDVGELADRITDLYKDRARRESLPLRADAFNQRYSWDRTAAAYAKCLERLAAGKVPSFS